MAKRPKTTKEKIYVTIKKSDEPMSKLMIALKIKLSNTTLDKFLPQLVDSKCVEEIPFYAKMMAMMARGDSLQPPPRKRAKFYRISKDHSCDFCKVFQ